MAFKPPGGMGNMNQMLKQAQKMQENMLKAKEEVEQKSVQASAGGGMVEVTITGKKEIKQISIKPEIVDPEDVEMLEDLVMAAVNEAIRKVEDTSNAEMEKITGSLHIPGLL